MCKWTASITMAGLALGSLLLSGSPAAAQSVYAPRIDQREAYQQQRIQQGVDNGSLTGGEARYLEREQGRIERAEDRMKADGNLSVRERERLNQMQNRASRDINRLENNNRTTGGWGGNNSNGWSGHSNSGWGGPHYGRTCNTYDPRVDRLEAYQQQRIQQGIHNGSLTGAEARYLEREQGRIDRAEDRMKADGNLSAQERQRLNQMQNRASRDINRLENNNRTAGGYSGGQAGWRGNNHSWGGNNPGGSVTPTAGNTPGWHNGSGNSTAANGTTPAGNTPGTAQGWHGSGRGSASTGNANYRSGQSGSYQQPGAQAAQGQQKYQRPPIQGAQPQMNTGQPVPVQGRQYQQARAPMPKTQMRPNANMIARQQPTGLGSMVNRASYSAPRAAPRRR